MTTIQQSKRAAAKAAATPKVVEKEVEVATPITHDEIEVAVKEEAKREETPVVQESPKLVESPVAETKKEEKSGNETADYLLMELEQYAEAMAPGKAQVGTAGATQQLRLFRLFDRVFNRVADQDFRPCMDTLVEWFNKHKAGVASEAYIYRFAAEWSATQDEFTAFTRFANMLVMCADPKSRSVLIGQLNFEFYQQYGLTEEGRGRVLAYFGK